MLDKTLRAVLAVAAPYALRFARRNRSTALAAAEQELTTVRELVARGGDLRALVFSLSGPAVQVLLGVIAHFQGDEDRGEGSAPRTSLPPEPRWPDRPAAGVTSPWFACDGIGVITW